MQPFSVLRRAVCGACRVLADCLLLTVDIDCFERKKLDFSPFFLYNYSLRGLSKPQHIGV